MENEGALGMNCEIIAVGTELLLGQIANTNAQFLSRELSEIGVNVYFHSVVGDNPERLRSAIHTAQSRSDLIIFTGGLGPTKDDLTKETIASYLGLKLIVDETALARIKAYFENRGLPLTENNKKQANVFENSTVLPNDNGMAPGMFLSKDEKYYMLLPGPPNELNPMFQNYGRPIIENLLPKKESIQSRVLRFFGIGESALEKELEDLIEKQTNPTIAPLATDGEVTLRLTVKHAEKSERNRLLDDLEEKIRRRVGKYIYGYDDTSLVETMAKLLHDKQFTLAAAESLTGGYFQQSITSIPGVSSWFKGGIVSYWTEIKSDILQVQKETIERCGVVSAECAKEMAENVRRLFDADIGVSFTGVAGPDKLEDKEPGTVYIGVSIQGISTKSFYLMLNGNREDIRRRSVKHGAWAILRTVYGQYMNN